HDYTNIDLEQVWGTAVEDIPALISMIEPLVPPEEPAP
ncbi:MAG: HepT-like ribonuclease domain-containing protein, partial [Chloroflexota bacterium]